MVPIEKELDYVKRYVALQQMRFEQQLILDCEMDSGAADIRIPKMTIQPLIECDHTRKSVEEIRWCHSAKNRTYRWDASCTNKRQRDSSDR